MWQMNKTSSLLSKFENKKCFCSSQIHSLLSETDPEEKQYVSYLLKVIFIQLNLIITVMQKTVQFLKSIILFFDLHLSLLKFLSAKCVTIKKLDKGQQLELNHELSQLEYLYIYEGAVSIKLQDKYSVKSKKQSLGNIKHNMRM